ncbi:MAG: terpene cyclase/mutase family protein [Gemmataceae bacterium]|nr:terpene cyclase/mutase family protein [Gemmataceae bacterium]MCI0742172.1 terpene cyclase/mutase family protein [Gemmataceae bacterium]
MSLRFVSLPVLACLAGLGFVAARAQDAKTTWNDVTGKAAVYLKSTQEQNGGWSTAKTPGVTGVCLTGLLKSRQITAKDPVAEKALKYIEGLVNREKKHIAGQDPKVQLQNYVTSINVMALMAADRSDKYQGIIDNAVEFLKRLQWDEEEGKDPKSDFYGGAGYDSKSRPDLSNTQYFLDALKSAGVTADDPALKKALLFVNRCQNLKSEANDQAWAKLIDDGSFIYTAATGGATKVTDTPLAGGALPGYGSMTYAGIKSMIYCGVSKDDPRVKKALEWIASNYTVDKNPGMPEQRSQWGMYYYYNTMAKCLDALGLDYVVDAKGQKHDWRKDITQALAKRQRPDGSFQNDAANWMEADSNLVTGYALLALSYCRPK